MIELSDKWGEFLRNQPETGMGYWVVSVRLHDGRRFDRVVIVDSGHLTEIFGERAIPFGEEEIAELIVTHDKWDFDRAVLEHFRAAMLRHFSPLMKEFRLAVVDAAMHPPDVWVRLRNRTTQLMIDYEWGAGCWLIFGRLTWLLRRVVEERSLEAVVNASDPAAGFQGFAIPEYDFEEIDRALQQMAALTRTHALGLLRGDFSR